MWSVSLKNYMENEKGWRNIEADTSAISNASCVTWNITMMENGNI